MKTIHRFAAVAACLFVPHAAASCGAAFCAVNADWASQGAPEPGVRFDLRYETIDLDQPRLGRERAGVGQVHRHHDEIETRNRNWVATAEWTLAPRWALNVSLPFVDRRHSHIHNHQGHAIFDAWDFRGLGDVRVQARHVVSSAESTDSASAWGVIAGVELPTGSHDKRNAEGLLAERSLQPGSGTTDAIAGVFWHSMSMTGWSRFARLQATLPTNSRDGFKPGDVLQLDVGGRYALDSRWAVMLQLNALSRGRDRGSEAEPEDSGQVALFASPGVSFSVSRDVQLYAFYQRSLYQRVNGVQLTADWSALAGVSWRF
jgi:hypothetical protein